MSKLVRIISILTIKINLQKESQVRNPNAQEAHECIRPVNIAITKDDISDSYQKKLYDIIWKRTLSCFMPMYKEDIYNYKLTAISLQSKYAGNSIISPTNEDYFTFSLKKNNKYWI